LWFEKQLLAVLAFIPRINNALAPKGEISGMSRLFPFLLLVSLAACNHAPKQDAHVPYHPDHWKLPADATKSDNTLIVDWYELNDSCQRSQDPKVYDPVCKMRNNLKVRLRKLGWCWGAPSNMTLGDADWHQCGAYDTDNPSNADPRSAKASKDDPAFRPSPPDPGRDNFMDEQVRPMSPSLAEYKRSTRYIDEAASLANELANCGIKSEAWHHKMRFALEQKLSEDEIRLGLTPAEVTRAQRYNQWVIDANTRVYFSRASKDAHCKFISKWPGATSDEGFLHPRPLPD
jgi:hypothetical protein